MIAHINDKTTIPDLIRNVLQHGQKQPSDTFLQVRGKDGYEPITFETTINNAKAVSAYLYDLGVKKGDRCAMLMDNCPEFVFFDQGLQHIGGVNVSIYPTLAEKEIEYILKDSGARAVVVGNPFLLKKLLKIAGNCPDLTRIIPKFDDLSKINIPEELKEKVTTFSAILKKGEEVFKTHEAAIHAEKDLLTQDDIAALIYTSGTTGTPKGVMLTHGNFVTNVKAALSVVTEISGEDVFLSFLPLSHVFERTATYLICLTMGTQMAFAESLEALPKNMMEVRPTIMAAVPRLMEKIHDKAMKNGTSGGGLKPKIFLWAIKVGSKVRELKEQGKSVGAFLNWQHGLAEKLVFSKVKEKTGGRIRFMITGGAALPQNVGEFFGNLGIKVLEGYGLTETSPIMAVNTYDRQVFGAVGIVPPGMTVAIQNYETMEILTEQTYETYNPTYECPEGEIILKGPNVMKGYWNKPKETAEVIDKDGWFHTGDVGKFEKGYLKITDRIKNMLVNAYGKNVYPTPVENTYLRSPKIEQMFLIGDKREFISAIIVPSQELLQETFDLPNSFFEEKDQFIEDDFVRDWLKEDVNKLSLDLAKFERIKTFKIKRVPFTLESGELTPTLKTKRKIIMENYAPQIEELYS